MHSIHRPPSFDSVRPRAEARFPGSGLLTLLPIVMLLGAPLAAQDPGRSTPNAAFDIHGAVVDGTGAPVSGARVELQRPLTAQMRAAALRGEGTPEAAATTRTDGRGEFTLRAPGPGFWNVTVEAEGFAGGLWDPHHPIQDELSLPPFALERARTVEVRLVDGDGEAVTDALPDTVVSVLSLNTTIAVRPGQPSIRLGGLEQFVATDGQGRARVEVPRDAAARALALVPGALPGMQRIDEGESTATLELRPARSRPIRVLLPGGAPVPNVAVFANRRLVGATDGEGRLDLPLGLADATETPEPFQLHLSGPTGAFQKRIVSDQLEVGADAVATVVLEPLPVLRGRVTDTSGRPLAGAWVWTTALEHAVADDRGRFALPSEQEARPLIQGMARDHFRGSQRLLTSHFASGTAPTLALEPAVHVEGRVTSRDGAVSGASIRWAPKDLLTLQGRGEDGMGSRGRSRSDGAFRLGPLPPGVSFALIAEHPDFARVSRDVAAIAPGQSRTVDVEMAAGALAFGTVVDEGDVPVAGAQVELLESAAGSSDMMALISRQMGLGPVAQTAISDADGTFRFLNLGAGSYDLVVRADGFAPARVPAVEVPAFAPASGEDAEPAPAFEIGTIALAPGAILEGEVRAKGGHRLSEARVVVREAAGTTMMVASMIGDAPEPDAVTGTDGRFVIDSLSPDSSYRVEVERDGYQGVTLPAAKAGGDPLEVELEPASTLAGVVKNELGEALEGARLTLQQQMGSIQGGMMNFNPRRMVRRATTDEDGVFEIDGIGTGTWDLVAAAQGYIDLERKGLEIRGGQELDEVELRLQRGGTVRGQVLSASGDPVVGATVERVVQQRSMLDLSRANRRSARSDGDGNFVLDGLPLGATSFSAKHDQHQERVLDLEVQSGDNRLDFVLERGLSISGRVLDPTGLPVGGATVSAASPGGGMMFVIGVGGPKSAVTDTDGTYRLEGFGAGSYEVTAKLDGFAPARTETPVQLDRDDATSVDLQLETGAAITGLVDGLSFDELSQVQIMAMQPGASAMPLMAQVDYEGAYRIDNVPAGDWMVMATVGRGGRNERETVTIDPGTREMVVDFSFGGGLTLSGRVERNGEPVSGTMVIASATSGPGSGQTTTDPEGRYTLEGLEAGTYQVIVTSLNRSSHQETVELAGDQVLDIVLREATVRGRVVRADNGNGIQGAELTLARTDDGSPLAGLSVFGANASRTDAAGRFTLDGVGPGAYRLSASAEAWGTESVDFVVEESDIEGLEIALERTARLSVYIVRANGSIPTRVGVTVVDDRDQIVLQQTRTLAEEGRLDLEELPDGNWTLLVAESGGPTARQPITVPGDALTVALPVGGGIRLYVPELEQSGTSARVRLEYPDGRPYQAAGIEGMFGRSFAVVIDGRSQVQAIPVGTWGVVVETMDGGWSKRGTVRVVENQVIEYVID